jgi:predicted esterase
MPQREHRIVVPRTARYVTLGDGGAIAEIWFVLHGYSQLARHFIRWFEPAQRAGRLIVAPEALSRAYFQETAGLRRVGASWMTKEDRLAEIDDYVAYLDRVADEVAVGDPVGIRVEVHGFSQGGAAAARWVAHGRRAVDRLVLWGSTLPPDLDLDRLRARLPETPVVFALGDRDVYLQPEQMQAELARLSDRGVPARYLPFAGGHRVDPETLVKLGVVATLGVDRSSLPKT